MKFTQLAKTLKEGIAPFYVIEGEETYFRDHAVKSVRAACGISQPLLNDLRTEGETLKGDRLFSFRDDLYSLPFFDQRRLVRIYEFYPSEREWEVLSEYLSKPCPTTTLLIVNRGKKGYDFKRRAGAAYVDCSRENEETLSGWLFALMRRVGLSPEGDACARMVRYCASDAARMKLETEKLKSLLGEGGRVTCSVVEDYVAKDVEYKIYELTQAASRKNFAQFSQILNELLQKGYDEIAALSSLTSHYRTLAEIAGMRGTDAEISKVVGIKPYAVQKNRELAARLGAERVGELYRALYELTCGAKSGLYGKTGALAVATAQIFFG